MRGTKRLRSSPEQPMLMTIFRNLIANLLLISSVMAAETVAATSSVAAIRSTAAAPMVIKYHFSGHGDYHHTYHAELIHRVLEVTRPEFGNFQIQTYSQAPIARRQAALLREGELMNIQWAPPRTDIANAEVIEVPFDILRGLQGYRVLMYNRHGQVDFAQIKDLESFKKLRIGQGSGWAEISIYHTNGIRPLTPPDLTGLYPMLGVKRIDCIPLGINEIGKIVEQEKKEFPFIEIEPNLLVYYDFPIYFYVSKKHPEIARRFEFGLNKLKATGEFDQLFQKYHLQHVRNLKLQSRKIICLKSPFSHNQRQCEGAMEIPDFFKEPLQN